MFFFLRADELSSLLPVTLKKLGSKRVLIMEGGMRVNFCSLLQLSFTQGKNELTFLDSWPITTCTSVRKLRGL